MVKSTSVWLVLIIATALTLSACGGLAGDPKIVSTIPPRPTTIPVQLSAPEQGQALSVALGSSVFAERCTACHGQNGQGDGELVRNGQLTAPPDFTAPEWNDLASPMERYEVITNGRIEKLMPPWSEELSDFERWSVAMYVYSLSYTMDQLTTGEAIFAAECAECHGEDGTGTDDGPTLLELWEKNDGMLKEQVMQGSGDDMPAFADDLSTEEIESVVAYVRSLSLTAEVAPQVAEGNTAGAESTEEPFVHPDISDVTADETNAIGTVQGQMIHGTADGVLPAELPIRLHIIEDDMNETTMETITDAEGRFTFEDMLINSNVVFVASVEYDGGTYISDFQRGSNTESIDLPITVYDLTYDPSVLSLGSLVTQVFTFEDEIQVVEIIELFNDSDRIYMGTEADDDTEDGRQTVTFTLPENATYLNISDTERYILSDDGRTITDTLPVLPGEPHLAHLVYSMPLSDDRAEVTQTLDYPLNGRMEVHVENGAATVEGDGIESLGSFDMGGASLDAFGKEVTAAAGDTVNFTVVSSGTRPALATTSNATSESNDEGRSMMATGLLVAGIGMLALSGVLMWRGRGAAAPVAVTPTASDASAEELMQDMASLDMLFEEGKINEATYHKRRDRLKQQVAEILQRK